MELFDLVDDNDTVIGTTDKATSHSDAGIHRTVAIYVFTQKGELYLQDHLISGMWDHSVGGHVRKGETYDEAVVREGLEELGITGPYKKIVTFFSDETYRGKPIKHYFTLYEYTPPATWQFVPNREVKKIIPMPLIDVVKWMNTEPEKFTPGFMNTMAEYLKQKNSSLELHVR